MNIIYWDDKIQRELLINNLESWFPSAIKKYPTFFKDENYNNRILHVIFFIRRSGRMFGHKMEIVNEAFSKVLQDFDLIKPDVDILLNVLEFGGNVSWMKTSSVPIEDFKWEEMEARGQDCFDLACQELDKQLQMIKKHSEKCKTRMIRPFILLISNNDSNEEVGPYLQQLLTNWLFLESERYAIYLGEDFNPDIMKMFTGKKSKGGLSLESIVLAAGKDGLRSYVLRPMYEIVAEEVARWAREPRLMGKSGYSEVGAVVGATYPEMGKVLRKIMPHSFILVPGYGAQGGKGKDLTHFFNKDGLGAIVNSSRGIIAAYKQEPYCDKYMPENFADASRAAVKAMRKDIREAIG